MKTIRATSILMTALLFVGCSTNEYDRMATDYRHRSPTAEAKSDFHSHDYKIYSAMGFARYYPGLDPGVGRRLAAEHGVKMLPGTTDALESRSQARYIETATHFAAEYNRKKVFLIQQNPPKFKRQNKTVVATAGNVPLSLRSASPLSAVPHL